MKLYENARKKAHKIESIAHKIMRATELKITDAHANLNNIFWLMVTVLILGCAAIYFHSRKMLNSIYKLTLATNHIANGDLNQKLNIKSNDELGELAVTFNKMAENLKIFSLKEKNLWATAEKATKSEIQKAKELEQVQARLFQSSKLATLGEMSTGIAHEINQPLAGIALIVKNTSMLLAKNKLSVSNIKKDIKDIESMIQRISKIIYHIRVFAGQESMDFTNVNIHNTLEASLNLLREQLRQHNIKIIFNFSLNLPEIIGEPYQLEQVWINLIINARDAIETKKTKMSKDGSEFKGQINIKTKLRELKAKQFVEINVSDNGTGLNETQREKAFEPFFTSKEVGQGIGLGLPISYGIIKKHKGTIELKNQQAEGTSITVLLPIGEI